MKSRWPYLLIAAGILTALMGQAVLRWNRLGDDVEMTEHRETVRGGEFDGLEVYYRVFRLKDLKTPAPAAVVQHGFMASGEFYDANYNLPLARAGYVVASIDFRGHGNTGGYMQFPRQFPAEGFKVLPRPEVRLVFEAVSRRPDVDPSKVSLVGHSMGGHAVTDTALLFDGEAATVAIAGISNAGDFGAARNYLFLNCRYDQYISAERSLEMAKRFSDGRIMAPGQTMGSFNDGSARGYELFPACEHLMEAYHPGMSRAVISWLNRATGHEGRLPSNGELWTAYVRGWTGSGLALLGALLAAGAIVWLWGARIEGAATAGFVHAVPELAGGRLREAIHEEAPHCADEPLQLVPGLAGWKVWSALWFLAPLAGWPLVRVFGLVPLALAGPVLAMLWGGGLLAFAAFYLGTTEDERAPVWECLIRGAGPSRILLGLFAGGIASFAIAAAFGGAVIDYWPTVRRLEFSVLLMVLLLPPVAALLLFVRAVTGRGSRDWKLPVPEMGLLALAAPVLLAGMAAFRWWNKIMPLEWIGCAVALAALQLPLLLLRRRDELIARIVAGTVFAGFLLGNLLPAAVWEP